MENIYPGLFGNKNLGKFVNPSELKIYIDLLIKIFKESLNDVKFD